MPRIFDNIEQQLLPALLETIQVANHQTDNALPVQFVHYDKLPEEEKKKLKPYSKRKRDRMKPPMTREELLELIANVSASLYYTWFK